MGRTYPQVTFNTHTLLEQCAPSLYHSRFDIAHFHYADRIDLYALLDTHATPHRALFVDVGYAEFCGTQALDKALERKEISWENTQAFITHFHEDHDGNLDYCIGQGMREFFCGPLTLYTVDRRDLFLQRTGLYQAEGTCMHPCAEFIMGKDRFSPRVLERMHILPDHAHLTYDDYDLEVHYTPGHAPEHACLLERNKRILFAGDHILDAAPGHMQLDPESHILTRFLESLTFLKTLNLEHIYMSHTDALHTPEIINAFIDRIIESYTVQLSRMQELMMTLSEVSAYEATVAHYARHTGGLAAQSDFMRMRRTAIIYAYLDYLVDTGFLARRVRNDGAYAYCCA